MKNVEISIVYCSPVSSAETGWTSKALLRTSQVVHSSTPPFAVTTASLTVLHDRYIGRQASMGPLPHLLFRSGLSCRSWRLESSPCSRGLPLPPRVGMIASFLGEQCAWGQEGDRGRLPSIFAAASHAARASIGTARLWSLLFTGDEQTALDWPHSQAYPSKGATERNIWCFGNLS